MKVLNDLGHSPTAIAAKMQRSHNTIIKYLSSDVLNHPQIQSLIKKMSEQEIKDLTVIGAKARACQNNYLDDVLEGVKQPNPIAITAIGDRSFQQRQLLQGKSTEIIEHKDVSADMEAAIKQIIERDKKTINVTPEE